MYKVRISSSHLGRKEAASDVNGASKRIENSLQTNVCSLYKNMAKNTGIIWMSSIFLMSLVYAK